jgi:SAM-dependent methyltransferase
VIGLVKIPLVVAENIVFGIWPNLVRVVEKYFYNQYFFGAKHVKYTKKLFKLFLEDTQKHFDVKGKVLLELGPGGSIGFGLLALVGGVKKYVAIDTGNHAEVSKQIYENYQNLLEDKKILKSFIAKENGNYLYNSRKIQFLDIKQDSTYDLEDESVNVIYSSAVLEHVYDLDLCFSEMVRVLKRGGYMNHRVDLRDHIFNRDSLFFLRIPEYWFLRLFGNTGGYVNRKRFSDYLRLFEKFNLEILGIKKKKKKNNKKKRLLKKYSEDDLETVSFNILLRKK